MKDVRDAIVMITFIVVIGAMVIGGFMTYTKGAINMINHPSGANIVGFFIPPVWIGQGIYLYITEDDADKPKIEHYNTNTKGNK